jgi:hypothetical protein
MGRTIVQQAEIVVGDIIDLIRPAGAAPAHGVVGDAMAFNKTLFHHHHGLRRQERITIVAKDIQRCRCRGKALRQHHVIEHPACIASLPIPATSASSIEEIDQTAIPSGCRAPWIGRGIRGGGQYGCLIDRSINRSRFNANHVRHCVALRGGRLLQILGQGLRVREKLEAVIRCPIKEINPCRDRAVVVKREAEWA